jgi:hypothetical protein
LSIAQCWILHRVVLKLRFSDIDHFVCFFCLKRNVRILIFSGTVLHSSSVSWGRVNKSEREWVRSIGVQAIYSNKKPFFYNIYIITYFFILCWSVVLVWYSHSNNVDQKILCLVLFFNVLSKWTIFFGWKYNKIKLNEFLHKNKRNK